MTHLILKIASPAGNEVRCMWPKQRAQKDAFERLFALVNRHCGAETQVGLLKYFINATGFNCNNGTN